MSKHFMAIMTSLIAALISGCTTVLYPGTLTIGGGATYATKKIPPVCFWDKMDSRHGSISQRSFSRTCTETYNLGELTCTRTWRESWARQDAPGSKNDVRSSSYHSSQPRCVPRPAPRYTPTPRSWTQPQGMPLFQQAPAPRVIPA